MNPVRPEASRCPCASLLPSFRAPWSPVNRRSSPSPVAPTSPVAPVAALPVALDLAAPVVPPVPLPVTSPLLPEVKVWLMPPVPPVLAAVPVLPVSPVTAWLPWVGGEPPVFPVVVDVPPEDCALSA